MVCALSTHTVSRDQEIFSTSGFAAADELGEGLVELGRLQQVQGDEFAAEPGQRAEQLQVPGQRQAREIDLQKLRVAAPVAGTVKHRVGVVEDVFGRQADAAGRAESLLQINRSASARKKSARRLSAPPLFEAVVAALRRPHTR